ncbi:MAG: RNA pseudouridine synthase [Magnetospirillum sp.]|nr:RNA pseudouridine synthase [Magnetospirillum sp.]
MSPEEIQSRVLHQDQDVIVLNKPAGLPVHAGPNSPDHLELYLDALKFGWSQPPRLAHRLDRDTSGCLVLGRHDKAIRRLGKMFMASSVDKAYWTMVLGRPPEESGRIELPILKLTGKGGWRIVCDPAGQPAITDWQVLGSSGELTWIECVPRTGRTHQIRVHMKALGCPVRGDAYYGPDPHPDAPLHLHSRRIGLKPMAPSKPAIRVEAPPPPHMEAALRACGWSGG